LVETWARVSHTPVIPSHEVSGVVVDIGSGVTTVKIGDEVYGLIRFDRDGAAADYVAVAAEDLAAKPSTVSHTVAAALPLAGLTALQARVEHAHVQAGDKVLVTGGTGGVGGLTVQLAARFGAIVTTTIRSDAAELVRNLGAESDRCAHRQV
jgi:NADPH:quinone reductase-like Zn-dependent oxidoreductase